ncbi:hypothetical protein GCM10023204_36510 [Actinomycetospora succinea]
MGAEQGMAPAGAEAHPELLLERGDAVGQVLGGHDEVVDGGCGRHGSDRTEQTEIRENNESVVL